MKKSCSLLSLVFVLFFIENTSQTGRIYRRSISRPNKNFQCGIKGARTATDLITDGYRARLGEWPWHGALFHRKNRQSREYKCGATLIEESYALTAAHCVVNRDNGYTLSAKVVSVDFGYVKLFGQSRHGQSHEIHDIILHPKFDTDGSKHDIAILSLSSAVVLSNYVVPICLPRFDSNGGIHEIRGRYGFVVGFGLTEDESSDYSSDLKQAELPIVEHARCQESNPHLYAQLIYPGMFCAGFRNGTSVCNGDSGSGMYFSDGDKWTLQGITSFSGERQPGSNKCDVQNYAGFMNVRYYIPWIRQTLYNETDEDQPNSDEELQAFTNQSSNPTIGATPKNLEAVSQSVTNLAQKISLAIANPKSKTEIFSPVSIAGALSLLLLGSGGETREELMSVMSLNPKLSVTDIHKSFGKLLQDLVSNEAQNVRIPWRKNDMCNYHYQPEQTAENGGEEDTGKPVEIDVANGLFAVKGTELDEKYKTIAEKIYKFDTHYLDFENQTQFSIQTINDWVKQKSRGKITKIVSDLNPDTMFGIASTLYLSAEWEQPFYSDGTRMSRFFPNGPSKQWSTVPTMSLDGCFPYYYWEEMQTKVFGIPYKQNITMYILFPNESNRVKVRALQRRIYAESLNNIIKKMVVQSVALRFPKMQLQSSINFKQVLNQLGLLSVFDTERSDLYRVVKCCAVQNNNPRRAPLYVDEIMHKVDVAVHEYGTENGTVKTPWLKWINPYARFDVNGPFLMLIRHEATQLPLFYGSVFDPQ